MDDKELLEYAALAMGLPKHDEYDDYYGLVYNGVDKHGIYTETWNPLICDTSRFELIRKLEMAIDFKECTVWKREWDGTLHQEWWGGDSGNEAHAVLRVAAEIGKRKAGK